MVGCMFPLPGKPVKAGLIVPGKIRAQKDTFFGGSGKGGGLSKKNGRAAAAILPQAKT